jgi:hypothetical protein
MRRMIADSDDELMTRNGTYFKYCTFDVAATLMFGNDNGSQLVSITNG